jgi:hypothetical protein
MIQIFINILIFTLIFVFVIIITQQLFIPHYKIENFTNNNINIKRDKKVDVSNDEFILEQQKAGNINVLKERVSDLEVLKNQVINNSNKIKLLQGVVEEFLK